MFVTKLRRRAKARSLMFMPKDPFTFAMNDDLSRLMPNRQPLYYEVYVRQRISQIQAHLKEIGLEGLPFLPLRKSDIDPNATAGTIESTAAVINLLPLLEFLSSDRATLHGMGRYSSLVGRCLDPEFKMDVPLDAELIALEHIDSLGVPHETVRKITLAASTGGNGVYKYTNPIVGWNEPNEEEMRRAIIEAAIRERYKRR